MMLRVLKCMAWLFPDAAEFVAEGFFPVIQPGQRQLQWPGIGPVMWCLLLETVCFPLALFSLIFISVAHGLILMMNLVPDRVIPGLPSASSSSKGEILSVTRLDASKGKLLPTTIQGFLSRSEPVIIQNLPKETFTALAPGGRYSPQVTEEMAKRGTVLVKTDLLPRELGQFGQWIRDYPQKRISYMVSFAGRYGGTPAHMDGFSSQVYYVARGTKRVWICPRQYNHLFDFQSGYNSVFIPGSDRTSSDPFKWIQSVPAVWKFQLNEGDVLIFNNAACVHKFANVTETPVVFSMRLLGGDMSPVTMKHHMFNWAQMRYFIKVAFSSNKVVEKPAGIAAISRDGENVKQE